MLRKRLDGARICEGAGVVQRMCVLRHNSGRQCLRIRGHCKREAPVWVGSTRAQGLTALIEDVGVKLLMRNDDTFFGTTFELLLVSYLVLAV